MSQMEGKHLFNNNYTPSHYESVKNEVYPELVGCPLFKAKKNRTKGSVFLRLYQFNKLFF